MRLSSILLTSAFNDSISDCLNLNLNFKLTRFNLDVRVLIIAMIIKVRVAI